MIRQPDLLWFPSKIPTTMNSFVWIGFLDHGDHKP